MGDRGSAVVKVLCYKLEGRWFDPIWCQWIFRSHYGPGVDSASNRNEYQEYFLGVKAAGAQGAVLQIGRSLVRSQLMSVDFPIALWPWGRLSL